MSEVISSIVTMLSSVWRPDETDGITPVFLQSDDQYHLEYGIDTSYVFCYTRNTNLEYSQMGSTNTNEVENVSISVLTMYSRAHAVKMLNEVIAIIKGTPPNFYGLTQSYINIKTWTDNSHKKRKIWEFTIDCEIMRWNESWS